MELRDIRYFNMVAEHRNVTRAADALGLSATALSKSLRRLEKSVGAKLIKRTAKGVELTAVGNALIARAGTLQLALDDIRQEAADLSVGRAGHINVATAPGSNEYCITDAYLALLGEAPNVSLKTMVLYTGQPSAAVRNGQADFSVTHLQPLPLRHPDLIVEELFKIRYVVFASANHPLARRKRVTLTDLAKERWISDINGRSQSMLRELFVTSGLGLPRLLMESNSFGMRVPMIESSNLVALAASVAVQKAKQHYRLAELPVEGLNLEGAIGVSYRKDGYLSPAAKRMIEILKEQGRAITESKRRRA